MRFISLVLVSFLFVFSSQAFSNIPLEAVPAGSTVQYLAKIKNSKNFDENNLNILLDSQSQVEGLLFETFKFDENHKPTLHTQKIFSLPDIASSHGVVLDGDATHDVFILQGNINSALGQGDLVLRFLTNGLFGSYDQCGVKLRKDQSNIWHLINAYDPSESTVITDIFVQVGMLGISTVKNVCPEN